MDACMAFVFFAFKYLRTVIIIMLSERFID